MNTDNEFTDPMSDTDRKVGEIVRRIKAELEMHRAMEEDMMRRVLKEDRQEWLKQVRDAVTFFFSQAFKK